MHDIVIENAFLTDVIQGLSSKPKRLYPKYFYDARGDELFQRIMQCAEYYLTRAEAEILMLQSRQIMKTCIRDNDLIDIIELGAGDGSKTIFLLKEAQALGATQNYYPIDISAHIIDYLKKTLEKELPDISIEGMTGEYLPMMTELYASCLRHKLILFLGATIGNMLPQEAAAFLRELRSAMRPGDFLLIGFDLKKDPQKILDAYNDKAGITRAFNFNLLERINAELGGDFRTDQFTHFPCYDPVTGSCKSYLVSKKRQTVTINSDMVVEFEKDEPVFMEVSQKYDLTEIRELCEEAGFHFVEAFTDSHQQFADVLLRL